MRFLFGFDALFQCVLSARPVCLLVEIDRTSVESPFLRMTNVLQKSIHASFLSVLFTQFLTYQFQHCLSFRDPLLPILMLYCNQQVLVKIIRLINDYWFFFMRCNFKWLIYSRKHFVGK